MEQSKKEKKKRKKNVLREGYGKCNLFLTLSRKSLFSEMFKVRHAVSGILRAQNKGVILLCVSEKIGKKSDMIHDWNDIIDFTHHNDPL